MTGIAQQPRPDVLGGEGLTADMTDDDGIGPHRAAFGEIGETMRAQAQALGFE
jgi:hypothetical protein